MDIASYGAIVSTLAILLSGVSLWLHWRKHQQDQSDRQPEIHLEPKRSPEDFPPGWRSFQLTVRNMDRYSITVESVTVLWPIGARLAKLDECYRYVSEWQSEIVEPENPRRTVALDMRLPASGTSSKVSAAQYIHGDTHFVSLVVRSRPRSAHSLKVLIRQSSSSTSFKIRNRIMSARISALADPKSTKQATEN